MSQFMDMIRLPNFGLGVAKGQFADISHNHKFAAVPQMSQNTTGTVWDINDTIYPWSVWDSGAAQLNLVCSSASDIGLFLHVYGLDADYNQINETIEITATTGQTTSNSYIRVFRLYITDSGATNVGTIDLEYSTTKVARIDIGNGQTLMGIYTIPAGHTGYLLKGVASCKGTAEGSGYFYTRVFTENTFRVQHSFEFGLGNQYDYEFPVPLKIPEKTDLEVRATVRSNNSRVTAAFDILLDSDT